MTSYYLGSGTRVVGGAAGGPGGGFATRTVNAPTSAGSSVGDLLVLHLYGMSNGGTPTFSPPVGWVLVGSLVSPATAHAGGWRLAESVYVKEATGSDATVVTTTGFSSSLPGPYYSVWVGQIHRYKITKPFALTGTPTQAVDVDPVVTVGGLAGSTLVAPTITVGGPALIVGLVAGFSAAPSVATAGLVDTAESNFYDHRRRSAGLVERNLAASVTGIGGSKQLNAFLGDFVVSAAGPVRMPGYALSTASGTAGGGIWFAISFDYGLCECFTGVVAGVDSPANAVSLSLLDATLDPNEHQIQFAESTTGWNSPTVMSPPRTSTALLSGGPWLLGQIPYGTSFKYVVRRLDGGPISGSATLRATDAISGLTWDVVLTCPPRGGAGWVVGNQSAMSSGGWTTSVAFRRR